MPLFQEIPFYLPIKGYNFTSPELKFIPYKVGEIDYEAGFGKNEWISDNNIINKQIDLIKKYNLNGYALFRYDFVIK